MGLLSSRVFDIVEPIEAIYRDSGSIDRLMGNIADIR